MSAAAFRNGTAANSNYRIFSSFSFTLYVSDFSSLSCLGHVVNLGNVDVMTQITKIVVVENATAIWEYNPSQEDNHILGGLLDVIAALRTLAIKVKM